MEAQLTGLVRQGAWRRPRRSSVTPVLIGILPTIGKTDLGLDNMVPKPRYLRPSTAP
jgi:hypothetical protein